MWSTADTSAVPITANCSSCSGVQLTLAPRSSTVVTPVRVGSCEAIAGRSTPGSVLRTKREIAISAPVLPAETQASRATFLHQVDRDAHRRVLLPPQCVGRRLVHFHDFRRRLDGEARLRGGLDLSEDRGERLGQADGDDPSVRVRHQEIDCRGQRDRGAVVPPIASTATVIGMSAWPSSECGPASRTEAPARQVDQQGGGTGGTARAGRRDAAPSAATPRGARTGRYSSALVLTTFLPR